MFRILVYDVAQKRVSKVRRYLSDKMYWVQNSTFEGELTPEQKRVVLENLRTFLHPEEDSLLLFSTEAEFAWSRKIIGIDKGSLEHLLR